MSQDSRLTRVLRRYILLFHHLSSNITNRMLCPSCYQRGSHLGETEVSFSDEERAHWEWMQYALLRRIEEKVKIYSSQNMTQEELRSLVPSFKEEAA